jgi:hypothetical protein
MRNRRGRLLCSSAVVSLFETPFPFFALCVQLAQFAPYLIGVLVDE